MLNNNNIRVGSLVLCAIGRQCEPSSQIMNYSIKGKLMDIREIDGIHIVQSLSWTLAEGQNPMLYLNPNAVKEINETEFLDGEITTSQLSSTNSAKKLKSIPVLLCEEHEHLIKIQNKLGFKSAMRDLNENRRKCNHWIWWIFPTTKKGFSDPYEVCLEDDDHQIKLLLQHCDIDMWIEVIKEMSNLVMKNRAQTASDRTKGWSPIIPTIDHGRMRIAIQFWLDKDDDIFPNLEFKTALSDLNSLDQRTPSKKFFGIEKYFK